MVKQFVYMHVLLNEMDNGEVFCVKIPVNDLLSCKVSYVIILEALIVKEVKVSVLL